MYLYKEPAPNKGIPTERESDRSSPSSTSWQGTLFRMDPCGTGAIAL